MTRVSALRAETCKSLALGIAESRQPGGPISGCSILQHTPLRMPLKSPSQGCALRGTNCRAGSFRAPCQPCLPGLISTPSSCWLSHLIPAFGRFLCPRGLCLLFSSACSFLSCKSGRFPSVGLQPLCLHPVWCLQPGSSPELQSHCYHHLSLLPRIRVPAVLTRTLHSFPFY